MLIRENKKPGIIINHYIAGTDAETDDGYAIDIRFVHGKKVARLKNTFHDKTGPASSLGFFCITNDFLHDQRGKCRNTKIFALIFNFI